MEKAKALPRPDYAAAAEKRDAALAEAEKELEDEIRTLFLKHGVSDARYGLKCTQHTEGTHEHVRTCTRLGGTFQRSQGASRGSQTASDPQSQQRAQAGPSLP